MFNRIWSERGEIVDLKIIYGVMRMSNLHSAKDILISPRDSLEPGHSDIPTYIGKSIDNVNLTGKFQTSSVQREFADS